MRIHRSYVPRTTGAQRVGAALLYGLAGFVNEPTK